MRGTQIWRWQNESSIIHELQMIKTILDWMNSVRILTDTEQFDDANVPRHKQRDVLQYEDYVGEERCLCSERWILERNAVGRQHKTFQTIVDPDLPEIQILEWRPVMKFKKWGQYRESSNIEKWRRYIEGTRKWVRDPFKSNWMKRSMT